MKRAPDVEIARVRAYWNRRPCNVQHSRAPVDTLQYSDEVKARKYFVEPHIPRFAAFERWRGKRVLEIGCGIGTDTLNFARAGAEVTAVDLSEASLRVAQQRAATTGIRNITFYQANAEELDRVVPPEPYDLVYAFGVIHHTPRPERVMEQIRRYYTRPGSVVKVMVYHRYAWKVLWILLVRGRGAFWRLDELIAKHSEAESGCPITYTYSRRSVARLFEGLRITDVRIEHIFPYRIPDYVNHKYVKVWYFRYLPESVFRWLERHAGWHLCVTAEVPMQLVVEPRTC